MMTLRTLTLGLSTAASLLLAGCGGDGGDDDSTTGGSGGGAGAMNGTGATGGTMSGGSGTGGGATGGGSAVEVPVYVRRIVSNGDFSCVIEEGGTVLCWAGDETLTPLEGQFVELSANEHVCGVRTNGTVACTGNPTAVPAFNDFVHVAAMGSTAGCGQRAGGEIECWGYEDFPHPQTGDFDYMDGLPVQTCGFKRGAPATCWTLSEFGSNPTSDVASMFGSISWCQIESGNVRCDNASPVGDYPFGELQPGNAHQITKGDEVVCVLTAEGVRSCGGSEAAIVNTPPPTERFVELSAGFTHVCGILQSGLVTCWGTIVGTGEPASVPRDIRVF